jgi:hypothetical protein
MVDLRPGTRAHIIALRAPCVKPQDYAIDMAGYATISHMRRLQVQFTTEQADALQLGAAAADRPIAAIVREAVDDWIATNERRRRVDRALAAIGGFHSGLGDLAENHDRYLEEAGGT